MTFILQVLLISSGCFAQFANYNSNLLGDRAAGMGGAGTALLDDTSSAAFYNPALLSVSKGSAFSAAVGIYKKYDTQYGSESDYTQTPLKVSTGFFRSLPSSTGSMIRKENWTVGLSILVPEYETFKGDLKSLNTDKTTLSYTDETLWVGGSLSQKVSASSSWGLTLYYTARNFQRTIQDRSYPNASEAILFNSEEALRENSIIPIIGYLESFANGWNMGASLRFRNLPIASEASYFESLTRTNPYSSTNINENDLTSNTSIPAKLSLGASKVFSDDFLFSANIDLYEGLQYEMISQPDRGTFIVRKSITNVSLGGEQTFTDWFKVRLGVFSNFSPYPDPDPNLKRHQGEPVNQAGFSANFVFIADNKIAYTFGGYYVGGRGQAIERINQEYQVVTKSQQVFTMLVGTQFHF